MATDFSLFDRYREGIDDAVAGGAIHPAWSPDGKQLVYSEGGADWLVELSTGERMPLLDDSDALRATAGPATGTTGQDCTPRQYYRSVAALDPQPATELLAPNGEWLISTLDGNIMGRAVVDGRSFALTTDGTPEVDYRFDWAHPALISLGMGFPVCNFSPDSQKLAVYRVDNSLVARSPITHHLKREDEVYFRYAARAGGAIERYSLHVLDVVSRQLVDIDLGDGDNTYPIPVSWTPDNKHVLIAVLSRDCRTARVLLADAVTGESRELFAESGDSFLRTHHDLYFTKKTGLFLTPDGGSLLWLSERSGFKHLYLYSIDGTFVRALTGGDYPVDYVHLVTDTHVYLTAHIDQARPYDMHVVRVPLAGGPVEQLTEGEGVHRALFAPGADAFIDTYSTPSQPPRSVLRSSDGGLICDLSTGELRNLAWTPPRQFTVTAADGETELWGVMFFPADFDETRTYPLVEYVYGGPQIAAAPHEFGGHFGKEAHALAQLGYITVVLDGRGTPERSKAFHDVVCKNWSGGLVSDHAAAIEQLRERHSFISDGRVGVMGDSWGGHSAFRLAAERPDLYGAAVCSGPGFDPYSSVLYEPYLGQPQDDTGPYDAASCVLVAAKQQAELMIVSGTADFFSWSDAIKVSEQLIRAGKQHEFVVLPSQVHGYDSVHDRYFGRKYAAFFGRHLQNNGTSHASS